MELHNMFEFGIGDVSCFTGTAFAWLDLNG